MCLLLLIRFLALFIVVRACHKGRAHLKARACHMVRACHKGRACSGLSIYAKRDEATTGQELWPGEEMSTKVRSSGSSEEGMAMSLAPGLVTSSSSSSSLPWTLL
eukprot:533208-Pelagomonas_calceolata.AAC.5